jgi:hypothetical protein
VKRRTDVHRALAQLERQLMAAEYLLDSTTAHVTRKRCACIQPRALRRLLRALALLRGTRQRVRHLQGFTQWTLFGGSAGDPGTNGARGKQKPWRHRTPHGWPKDCDP